MVLCEECGKAEATVDYFGDQLCEHCASFWIHLREHYPLPHKKITKRNLLSILKRYYTVFDTNNEQEITYQKQVIQKIVDAMNLSAEFKEILTK